MGVGNPMVIPFPWESHGNGNSHMAHDGNGNGNGNKADGNGNSIYFTRVKIPQNYCDALDHSTTVCAG